MTLPKRKRDAAGCKRLFDDYPVAFGVSAKLTITGKEYPVKKR